MTIELVAQNIAPTSYQSHSQLWIDCPGMRMMSWYLRLCTGDTINTAVARSEMRRHMPARRRFDNMCIRLGIRVWDLQYLFRGCRMVDANMETAELSALFCLFLCLITYYSSRERSVYFHGVFDDDSLTDMYIIRVDNSNLLVKANFSSVIRCSHCAMLPCVTCNISAFLRPFCATRSQL